MKNTIITLTLFLITLTILLIPEMGNGEVKAQEINDLTESEKIEVEKVIKEKMSEVSGGNTMEIY